jgi:hypothetical protein
MWRSIPCWSASAPCGDKMVAGGFVLRLTAILLLTLSSVSCTGPANGSRANARLQSIPAASGEIYKKVDLKSWKNPYVVVRADGVGLLDASNNEEHLLKTEELPDALAELPATAWPYGRVVALADDLSPSADKNRIRENKARVASLLHSSQLQIQWVPSS